MRMFQNMHTASFIRPNCGNECLNRLMKNRNPVDVMKLLDILERRKTAQVATGLTGFQDASGWNICRDTTLTGFLQSVHPNDGKTP
jgi:hypothetical protein